MRIGLAAAVLTVAFAVAGCGGGGSPADGGGNGGANGEASKSASQVLADAVNAADAASSVHVSGQGSSKGQKIALDLTIVKKQGATGSFTLRGQKIDLVIIGTDAYMRAGAGFYTEFAGPNGAAIGRLMENRWLKFSTSDPQFGSLTGIASSKTIFDQLALGHGRLTNKGATTYHGQSVVDLFDPKKNGTLYVAATGTAYPVALIKTAGHEAGTFTFDDWNTSVTLSAPSGAIDISQLGG